MRVLILGGDGYLGWPTAMHFAVEGHDVSVVDNYLRRKIAKQTRSEPLIEGEHLAARCALFEELSGKRISSMELDLANPDSMLHAVKEHRPDVVVHYAEQPSAPYSMMSFETARLTLNNNLSVTFNLIWAVLQSCPNAHIIKLGTMGEYGTPNIDIEEGWIEIEHKGRRERFLFPRQAGSLYHTTKILDTDLLWFYVRNSQLQVTDLMQGPVYGLSTDQADLDDGLVPNFHYDDIFGTVVNRFIVQAAASVPLTVYGRGGQTRGYLNLRDTLQCVQLAAESPPGKGQMRILNQITETFSVNQIAERIKTVGDAMGLAVDIKPIGNPRKEAEEHYYNPTYSGLKDLGLRPHHMTDDVLAGMIETVLKYRNRIDRSKIMPRVRWS